MFGCGSKVFFSPWQKTKKKKKKNGSNFYLTPRPLQEIARMTVWKRSLAPFKFNNEVTFRALSRRLIEYLDDLLAGVGIALSSLFCPVSFLRFPHLPYPFTSAPFLSSLFMFSNGMKTHYFEVFKLFHKVPKEKSFSLVSHPNFSSAKIFS